MAMAMAMELELDPRHKVLPFKVRAVSKESQPHKAAHVLDIDPKNHWSTSTNTKEWILLELEEPALLQQIRIHNKSVLEWEIALGLRYKPESFMKARTRCEAPRRESQYMTNHTPCRYVRLSCLRGNPIAVYSIQLIGISMPGLEPEFQPLVDHLLPNLTSNKHDVQDIYLQLLREIMTRLAPFVTHLEGELNVNAEGMETTLRYLCMLSGPFYPILMAIDEREKMKALAATTELDSSKSSQSSLFTVSSNFQAPPRRSRSPVPTQQSIAPQVAFRPDVVLFLMKVAFRDSVLGTLCRMVAKLFLKLTTPIEVCTSGTEPSTEDDVTNTETSFSSCRQTDYSSIFGEEFRVADENIGEIGVSPLLDIASVEEGLLHMLYACVSKPLVSRRLAETKPDLVPVLPFIQAVLPALRPTLSSVAEQPDENFTAWQGPLIQRAVSQIVSLVTTPSYSPLLDACAGYLSSFSLTHERAACIIIDLCSGPLASWLPMVVAKVDLAFELVEGILGYIQVTNKGASRARAALVYIMIGLSGHVDECLTMYKDVKHNLLFVIEILESFLLPAITPVKNMIAFGDVSTVPTEKQERICAIALDVLRLAVRKPTILPSLEREWRKGDVKPSVLLSLLAPQLPLPPGIDSCTVAAERTEESISHLSIGQATEGCPGKVGIMTPLFAGEEEVSTKAEVSTVENSEDPSSLFVPPEIKVMNWKVLSNSPSDAHDFGPFSLAAGEQKTSGGEIKDIGVAEILTDGQKDDQLKNLHVDYLQLVNFNARELRAADFVRFALELYSQENGSIENRQAAVDSLLLAAECHLNPFFMLLSPDNETIVKFLKENINETRITLDNVNQLFSLEEERDKAVLKILLRAAEWYMEIMEKACDDLPTSEEFIVGANNSISEGVDMNTESNFIDATTLVRRKQGLLSRFLIAQLKTERDNMYETLLHGLLFLLYSATELSCSPEEVVDVILKAAKRLNLSLLSSISKEKKNTTQVTLLTLQRQWTLLCRLVAAASGGESVNDDDDEFGIPYFVYYKELVPPSAWMSKITEFSSSPFPLVRFLGWKGLARFASSQQQTGIVLASDLYQLSLILSIFCDGLMSSGIPKESTDILELDHIRKRSSDSVTDLKDCSTHADEFNAVTAEFMYPEVDLICPNLRKQFVSVSQVMLDAVCLHLKGIPGSAIPDILSWFADICTHPYIQERNLTPQKTTKGYAAANVRFIILKLLEVILVEHMESIVPELPRVFSVVLTLCQSAYCDISLLDSVLKALKPVITYGMASFTPFELEVDDDPGTSTFESLCFNDLLEKLKNGPDPKGPSADHGAFLIFLSGVILSDLSIPKRLEITQFLQRWVNFPTYSSASSYYNYVCAFQKVFEACNVMVSNSMAQQGISLSKVMSELGSLAEEETPPEESELSHINGEVRNLEDRKAFSTEEASADFRSIETDEDYTSSLFKSPVMVFTSASDLSEFQKCMGSLVFALGPSLETVWMMHSDLCEKLVKTACHCILALNFLSTLLSLSPANRTGTSLKTNSSIYYVALDTLCQSVLHFQQSNCWQVGSCSMDFLFSQPANSQFFEILPSISSVLKLQSANAPRVTWRQYTIKWSAELIDKISMSSSGPATSLLELFTTLLQHREPEQRAGALQQLNRLIEKEETLKSRFKERTFFTEIVESTWENVASLAARDLSPRIRKQATELLIKYVPLAQPHHLQRLLSSAENLPGLAKNIYTMSDAPVTRMSLSLLSRACLYSTAKEISMIPARVWSSLEILSKQRPGNVLAEVERAVCAAVLNVREQGGEAKQCVQQALSRQTDAGLQVNMHFTAVRQSVLEVFARISASQMTTNTELSRNPDVEKEFEEAQLELELVNQERAVEGKPAIKELPKQGSAQSLLTANKNVKGIRQQIEEMRAQIRSQEREAMRADILARRERQRIARRERQLALEGWTLHEIELLQELDREKAAEAEKEIERLRNLERERAKTRELKHALDLENEKRNQRDLQRELEQRESGAIRPSRREFSTTGSGRPRERYRERDGGRSGQDTRSSTGVARENSTTPPATPTAALSQGHDRLDDRGYDDILDGIGFSGDAGSYAEIDGVGIIDAGSGGGSQRQGFRGSRPRQLVERRERENRREGKWERKQN